MQNISSSFMESPQLNVPKVPRILYIGTVIVFALYLLSVIFHWEFYYFLVLFCVTVLITAVIQFETAFLFVPLALANPYMLKETGTHLHLSELVLIIIFGVWIVRIFILNEKIQFPKKLFYPTLVVIVMSMLSLLVANHLVIGVEQIVRYVEILVIFFMVVLYSCKDEKRIHQIFFSLLLGGFIASLVGLGQFINNASELRQSTRIFGWIGGGYGALIASTLILSISALFYRGHKILKSLALLTIPVAGLALLLSQTRAWIGSLIVVLGVLIFLQKRDARRKILFITGLVIGLMIIMWQTNVFGLLQGNFFAGALQGAFRFGQSQQEHSFNDYSLFLRLNAWRKALELYLTHPILGIGVGNVRFVDYISLKLGTPGEGVGYVDNQYLQVFAEAGTVAGIAWLMYVVGAMQVGMKSVRQSVGTNLHVPAIGFLGCLMVSVIGSFFWVITPEHESFALMILYVGLLMNICDLTNLRQLTPAEKSQ